MALKSINPVNGNVIAEYEEHTREQVEDILTAVHAAFGAWRETTFAERGALFKKLAAGLRANKADYARLMAEEMGKPVTEAAGEVEKCAWLSGYMAEHAAGMLADESVTSDATKSYVAFRPLGVIFGIMPWNFAFWQVLRYAVPAMMAGNTTVLKHANNVTGAAMALEKLFADCGFPPDAFRALIIDIPAIRGVIEHPRVAAVTLTGSTGAGKAVGAAAGAVIKPSVLELGGSDPLIVLEDADLDAAAGIGCKSRLISNGQCCISAKRFIVVESVREAFEQKLVAGMAAARLGDPLDETTTLGPMARPDLRENLDRQVKESVAKGARVLLGGEPGAGAYYPATVLTDVAAGMPAYGEELFGPVAAVIAVKDAAEAVRVANDNVYGLGAAIFSTDVARAERIARDEIEAGACFVNALVKSDPRLPFGGTKLSGYGRELGSYGLKEFVNIKTIFVA